MKIGNRAVRLQTWLRCVGIALLIVAATWTFGQLSWVSGAQGRVIDVLSVRFSRTLTRPAANPITLEEGTILIAEEAPTVSTAFVEASGLLR